MQIGPGLGKGLDDEEQDSLTYFEQGLAQTIEDSIYESIEDSDSDSDHAEEDEDECSD